MNTKQAFFQPFSFEKLAKVEAENWWFRSRNRILLWVLQNHVGKLHRFLEVGCGNGFILEAIHNTYPMAAIYRSDYYEEGLIIARERVPSANFTKLDARKMLEIDEYDIIGAFDVIEHINEDGLVLSNLSRALKDGGVLLITVPQHPWLWSVADEYACHVRRYTRLELISKVTQSRLKIEYVTSFVSLLVPFMWLNRLRASDTNLRSYG